MLMINLALSLTGNAAAAYAVFYPIPRGSNISVSVPCGQGSEDLVSITSDDLALLTSGPSREATWPRGRQT